MSWLIPSLLAVLGFALWAALGKRATQDLDWVPVSLVYTVIASIVLLAVLPFRRVHWDGHGLWLAVVAGIAGAGGLAMFYLALSKGNASVVVPLVGVYPVITALIAVVAFDERIGTVQIVGVALATLGVVLIGVGT